MPTTWYYRNTNAPAGPTGELSTDTDSFPSVPADKNTPKDMGVAKGSAQTSVAGAYIAANKYTMARMFVGPALAAQTLTGSQAGYKVGVGTKESSASMNKYQRTFVYVWRSGSGNVKTIITPTSCATEHTTAERGCVITAAGASGNFSILENDRIVVEIWWDIRDGTTSYTATLYWDGTTDVVEASATSDAAGYFYCPQTLNLPVTTVNFSDSGGGSDSYVNPFRAMGFGETGHGTEGYQNPFRAMKFADTSTTVDSFYNPYKALAFTDTATSNDVFSQQLVGGVIGKDFNDVGFGSEAFTLWTEKTFSDTCIGVDSFVTDTGEKAMQDFGDGIDVFAKQDLSGPPPYATVRLEVDGIGFTRET